MGRGVRLLAEWLEPQRLLLLLLRRGQRTLNNVHDGQTSGLRWMTASASGGGLAGLAVQRWTVKGQTAGAKRRIALFGIRWCLWTGRVLGSAVR